MAKIYQLRIGKKQIGDVYYDEDDAIDNAKLVHSVLGMTVTIWEAEIVPDDLLMSPYWRKMKTMAKIYKLMIDNEQINDVYYSVKDARVNAKQVAIDTGKTVSIWGAEEHEAVPYDLLNWTWVGAYGRLTWGMEEEEEEE